MMNYRRLRISRAHFLLLSVVVGICGCASTPESRIRSEQALFESFPPEVQDNVRVGLVEPGYTFDMARLALGEPDETVTRTSGAGAEEVWIYTKSRPGFSLGLGGSTGGYRSSVGTGVGIHTGGRKDELMRVVFRNGEVVAVEENRRR